MISNKSFTAKNPKLTNLGLTMHKANSKIKKYIQSYWEINSYLVSSDSFKIAPDGAMGMIINLGEEITIKTKTKDYVIAKSEIALLGIYDYAIHMHFYKNTHVLGIRFNPAGMSFFFEDYVKKLIENIIIIEDKNLYKNIIENKDDFIPILDKYLLEKYKDSSKNFDIMGIISLIEKEEGSYDINDLINCADMSRRNFDRMFKKHLGMSLKVYARIIKLKYSRMNLQNQKFETLTNVSYESGYFDQSHFIKEFKNFMFETPKDYLQKKQKLSQKYNH